MQYFRTLDADPCFFISHVAPTIRYLFRKPPSPTKKKKKKKKKKKRKYTLTLDGAWRSSWLFNKPVPAREEGGDYRPKIQEVWKN